MHIPHMGTGGIFSRGICKKKLCRRRKRGRFLFAGDAGLLKKQRVPGGRYHQKPRGRPFFEVGGYFER